MKKFNVLMILLLSSSFISCSKLKEFQKKTDRMAKTTRTMKKNTENMGQWGRAGETESKRNDRFEDILNVEKDKAGKLYAAGVYFKAFEFQLWSGTKDFDTISFREKMFFDAASEFLRRTTDLYEKIDTTKMSPINSKTEKFNEDLAFYALAATMHMTHNFQDILTETHPGIEHVSMFTLMTKALKKDAQYKKLKKHEEVFVNNKNKEICIELLKARVNFMLGLALNNLTNKEEMTLKQKISAGVYKISKGKWGQVVIPSTVEETNATTKMFANMYLDFAKESHQFLKSINENVTIDIMLESAFKNLEIETSNKLSAPHIKKIKQKLIYFGLN